MPRTPVIESIDSLRAEFETRQHGRRARLEDARRLLHRAQDAEAEGAYRTLLLVDPRCDEAWYDLATLHRGSGRLREAIDAAARALALEPDVAAYHHGFGLLMRDERVATEAADAYIRALGHDGTDTLASLEAARRRDVAHDPNATHWMRLGNVLVARCDLESAVHCYTEGLRTAPRMTLLLANLSTVHDRLGNPALAQLWQGYALAASGAHTAAIAAFRSFVEREVGTADVYLALGDCCIAMLHHDEAIAAYELGLRHHPDSVALSFKAAGALQEVGRTADAIAVAQRGSRRNPTSVVLKQLELLMLPVVYATAADMVEARERFAAGLHRLTAETPLETLAERRAALDAIGTRTNFYLPYQGLNDRDLQLEYGRWAVRVMASNFPQWSAPLSMPALADGERIRIGYVSAHCYNHAVANIFLGWLRHADRQSFDVRCYHLGTTSDVVTDDFRRHSDLLHQIPDDPAAAARQILGDRLHVLVHLDVGMAPISTQLAALRLAPVQCATWGHPVTTGMPTIDYFVSTDLMEPPHGEDYYSETLVRLPKIGVSYQRPEPPRGLKARSDFGIGEDDVVFLGCQSPYKYLPQHDHVFVEIAQRVPRARFVFVSGHPASAALEARIRRAFAAAGMVDPDNCRFLPGQVWIDYLGLLLASDLFLDTIEWTGCNTSLDAIGLGLPIVTRRTDSPRGRYTSAFLTVLGVTDTITASDAEYIDAAVSLALDRERRTQVSEAMLARAANLFDETENVRALERFYSRTVGARTEPLDV